MLLLYPLHCNAVIESPKMERASLVTVASHCTVTPEHSLAGYADGFYTT